MLTLLVNLLALFVIGFIQDLLGAYYLRLVNENRAKTAAFISFIHSMFGWLIWMWFMYQFQHSESMTGYQAVAHSIGGSLGVWLGIRKPADKVKV